MPKSLKLVIDGRLMGLNEYIDAERSHRNKASKAKKEVQEYIRWFIIKCLRGARFTKQVDMHYSWFEPDRRRDKSNIAFAKKFIEDSLVGCKVLADDGWDEIRSFTDQFFVDKKRPRVEVIIEEVE